MCLIKKISEKFSLTKTEAAVFLFLGIALIIGSGYRYFTGNIKKGSLRESDSLLVAAGISEDEASAKKDNDYKAEVLDFSNKEWDHQKILPEENSININTAGMKELLMLPGVGEKTAKSILDYRAKNGNIVNVNDLIEVKGIGEAKLDKIKKYIYIEQNNSK
jgi:competence protein ComEA